MKNIITYLITFGLVLSTKISFAHAETILVNADYWCPYTCHDKDIMPGYMIEILQEAFGKESIKYKELVWARTLQEVVSGYADALAGTTIDDAPNLILSEPIGTNINCFYTTQDNPFTYTDINSISKMKLGVINDYAYFEKIDSYIKENLNNKKKIYQEFGNNSLIRLIENLQKHKVDVIVDDPNVVSYLLEKNKTLGEVKNAGCVTSGNLYVAFSPAKAISKERVQKLNKTIKEMIKNGKMSNLLKKYSVKKWYK